MQNSYATKLSRYTLVLLILLLAGIFIPNAVLGARVVKLSDSQPLVGYLSQALGSAAGKELPQAGKDYKIASISTYSNNTWVLVSFKALNKSLTDGYILFKQVDGNYAVALGPGTSFSSDYLVTAPQALVTDMRNKGIVYEPDNQ